MRQFAGISQQGDDEFLRDVGGTREQFLMIRDRLVAFIAEERTRWPIKQRGQQSSRVSIEDRWLLPLTYLRHSPTFQQFGQQFGISESYAHTLYERHRNSLVRLLRLPRHPPPC